MSNEVGSVTARIILDTEEFNAAIKDLKDQVATLKDSLSNIKGINSLNETVQQLKKDIDSLKKTNENYRKTIDNLRTKNEELLKSLNNSTKHLKEEQTAFEGAAKAAEKYILKTEKIGKRNTYKKPSPSDFTTYYKVNPEIEAQVTLNTMRNAYFQYDRMVQESAQKEKGYWQTRQSSMRNAMEAFVSRVRNATIEQRKFFATSQTGYSAYIATLGNVSRAFGKVITATNKVNKTPLNLFNSFQNIQKLKGYQLDGEGNIVNVKTLGTTTNALKTFNFQVLELARNSGLVIPKLQAFENRLTGLAQRMARLNSGQGKNWTGRIVGGYSQYISSITKINQALTRQAELEAKVKAQRLDQYYAKVGAAATKYWNQIRKGTINLNTYKSNMGQINEKLSQQTQRTERLKRAQQQLWSKYHTTNLNTYKANMSEINAELAKQTTNTRKAGKGITTFNNGIVQTAHSGRILSNTLYQIRGALLSLKMIFTAMGGMALWGFASSVAEGVKDTITAKNEMDAQLKQMFTDKKGYTDWSSIKYFRRELDKLPQTFQKVNKYSVGETASSIGLEFDLTAKQMKDALPIITMIQSEYVRAGRKEAEAALAVKDILQGEFQRLSRETGVGKEELEAYGWSGDKSDVTGILKAVQKAGLDRHWDVFAKKATSLNDVLTITKSRFSELGAEIVDSVTPMVVGGFNAIIDALTGLQNAFGSLDSFWQNFVLAGGSISLFGGILTALPMVTKGMGLAEIATLGWKKSIATAIFNLNKSEVSLYGFRKALAAVIAGTKASELSNVRWTKAIAGRILGVKQATLAEHGYLTALVKSKMQLNTYGPVMNDASIAAMNLRQKIIYLAKGELVADKASAGWGKTIKSLITSTKLWRIALLSITGVGLVAYLSSVAAWADTVKSRVETYHKVLAEGKDEIKNLQDRIDFYDKKLAGMSKSDKNYDLFAQNQETLKHNLESTKAAYKYAKEIKKETKEQSEIHKGMISRGTEESYRIAGVKSILERSTDYQQVKKAAYDLKKAEDESYKFNYQSLQHINEKVGLMKQDADLQAKGIKDEKERAEFEKEAQNKRIEYIAEYSSKAEEAAQHLKEFNQGDITAGMYYLLDLASLKWIDLWNDDHFLQFWKSLNDTWKDLQPTLREITKDLTELGHLLLDFFSTKQGQIIGGIAVLGVGLGIIGLKLKGVWDKLKPVRDIVGSLKDKWKDAGDEAEKASEKMGGKVDPEGKVTNKYPQSRGEWWQDTKGQLYNDATKYARAAVAIAAGMLLISEAVLMLTVPMWSLAQTGKYFKSVEPNIREGIEGLKLIAPVIMVLLPPVIALAWVMDRYGPDTMQIVRGAWKAAVGIAAGMLLVAEAVAMMNAPLLAIASVGYVFNWQKDAVLKGKEALQLVTDCLVSLAPTIPLFIAGIALMALAFAAPEIGIPALAATALGIGAAMLLVAEAVVGLNVPLGAIAQTGQNYPNLDDVKQGAEALKITAEALGYVEEAMNALAGIAWASLSNAVAQLVGVDIGVDLTQLSGKGGFFEQLSTFTKDFNDNVNITPINQDKVTTLSESATGIDSVKTALNTVKDALKDLPNFNVDNRSTNEKYQDAVGGKGTTEGITNYFEQLKEPITQLNSFIKKFNELKIEPVEPEQVSIIQNSANAISTIQTAIEAVKNAVGAGVDAQWNANVQTSGILGAGLNLLVGNAGQSSGVKAGLDELYNCVKDIMDFNTRINGLTSEGSGDTSGIQNSSNMVSALQTEINNLKTTLDTAVPTVKAAATGLGSSIVTGLKDGLTGLDTAAKGAGETIGSNLQTGFKDKFKIQDIATGEVDATLTAISGKDQDFYDKGKAMGEAFQRGYKDGGGINSPGYAAQAMQQEIGYMEQYINDGMNSLPQMAFDLGNLVSSNFNFDLGLSNLQLPDLTQFQDGLSSIIPTVTGVKDNVSLQFTNLKTNIGTTFGNILSNTKLNMGGMLSATTKNIGAIRTSWKGMQTALITSAENIKTQTGQKISTLKTNLGDFWNKIKHPDQLISGHIGSAGSPNKGTRPIRYGGSQRLGGGYAGSPMFKPKFSSSAPDDDIQKYLACMMTTGSPCFAGWNFNWTSKISDKFNGWNTHFNKFNLDSHLNVGKFKNSNFPVRGVAEIARDYISEVIRGTTYDFYFNEKYGSPAEALRAGSFNCFDGTRVVLALAEAFGFGGGDFGHGTWNGIGHVWASIPGLGIIDPTALQKGQGFKSPSVRGYGAGTPTQNSSNKSSMPMGNTYNTNIEINVKGSDVEVNNKKISKESGKQILDILGINPATGR